MSKTKKAGPKSKFDREQLQTLWDKREDFKCAASSVLGGRYLSEPLCTMCSIIHKKGPKTKKMFSFSITQMCAFALDTWNIDCTQKVMIKVFQKMSPEWTTGRAKQDERAYMKTLITNNPKITQPKITELLLTKGFTDKPRAAFSVASEVTSIRGLIKGTKTKNKKSMNKQALNQIQINLDAITTKQESAANGLAKMVAASSSSSSSSSSNRLPGIFGLPGGIFAQAPRKKSKPKVDDGKNKDNEKNSKKSNIVVNENDENDEWIVPNSTATATSSSSSSSSSSNASSGVLKRKRNVGAAAAGKNKKIEKIEKNEKKKRAKKTHLIYHVSRNVPAWLRS